MSARSTTEVSPAALVPEGLDARRLVMTPLLVRILALVAVMLLAHIP